jgi:hypothetical protein
MQVHVLFSAGMLPIMVVAAPGVHGEVVTGMQGMGVSTPRAAVGLAIDMHIPKGGILVIGIKSMMLAAGAVALTRFTGNTLSAEGAIPKVHIITAPEVTCEGMGGKVDG